jgi:hypothetical protein
MKSLREEKLREHSKRNTSKLAKWVSKDIVRFDELMNLFLHDEYRVIQRAAWIVRYVAEDHPDWISGYLKQMLEYCQEPVPDAVKRNVMRVLQDIEIPKKLHGIAATICFQLLASRIEPVAVKVFSMTVITNITKDEPGLKDELRVLIKEQMDIESAAFK